MRSPEVGERRRRRPVLRTLLAAGTLAAAACGGDDDGGTQAGKTPKPVEVVLTATDDAFAWPEGTEFEVGQEIEATVVNKGEHDHDAAYMREGQEHDHMSGHMEMPPNIAPGESYVLTFIAEDGSKVECFYHDGMDAEVPIK